MNYKMITYVLGLILMFESAFLLVPSATALIYGETGALSAFLITVVICFAVGGLMIIKKPKNKNLPQNGLSFSAPIRSPQKSRPCIIPTTRKEAASRRDSP